MNVIVDYGCGNSVSIQNMLAKIGERATISSDPADILSAGRLILPGVGSFDHGTERIESLGIKDALSHRAIGESAPVLGICLGFQLMCRASAEGARPGLGWLDADVVRFDTNRLGLKDKVPHMGWGDVHVRHGSRLLSGFSDQPRFYFVHSYHVVGDDGSDVVGSAHHGYDFVAAIEKRNIAGVQFHPEKSHAFGMRVLKNFVANFPALL